VPVAAIAPTFETRSSARQEQTRASAIALEDVLLYVSLASLLVAMPLAGAVVWLGMRRRKPQDAQASPVDVSAATKE
jgi:hypothetical protein